MNAATAAISGSLKTKLETLRPNDSLTVWHGTRLSEVFEMINGFDANKIRYRHYGGPKHAGLFITPDPDVAAGFASYGEIVLEIETKARNLHGVDYSGNIGREQDMSDETREWIRAKHPKSFRPYLTMTMLQQPEPQGLLRGLVKPSQIKRVRYKPYGKSPVWYTRKQFLDLGLEAIPASDLPYGTKRKLVDVGYDLSYPGYSLEQFAQLGGKLAGVTSERFMQTIERRAKRGGIAELTDFLEQVGFAETAAKRYASLVMKRQSIAVMLRAGRVELANAIAYRV